jgi:predicted lysophospholipase L1 biosynthesis ABC-type transport system permease subunit
MLYMAFSLFVGTSLALAIDTLIGNRHLTTSVATGLSMIGVSLMLLASINLVREALAALSSNRQEIAFFRDLQARRIGENRCVGA